MERELSPMEQSAKEAMIDILKDVVDDNKKIIRRLQFTIVFIVALLIGSYIFYDYSFKNFVGQYDFEITTTEKGNDSGVINTAKAYGKNSNVNSSISDININTVPKK